MSQPKITLRPPPNIDFVQGFPGIPSGAPDRPQAAVKGAIEFRAGPLGVKAKWVRIELRKVETLPGGGITNTFFDFVGQSPITVWKATEEYGVLTSQDFPFYIRIPESIPPSIALEKGAGVKYELIATVCIKGKKGFLRRGKPNLLSQSAPIVIDKHELHTTWPVYTQPEGRKLAQDQVTLTVERTHTCYGPADRISVMAAVKSDSFSTVILRGFEFSLRETTVFRAGPNTTGRKSAPQVKVVSIGEQKVPVNATLYGGTQHKAELAVVVPAHHTSTTLNAARHIDINYVLTVRALMGTGKPLVMDLPVIISNWPRNVSIEAVKRIGMAPNVMAHHSGVPPQQSALISAPAPQPASTGVSRPSFTASDTLGDANAAGKFSTAPATNGYPKVNEWGVTEGMSTEPGQIQTIGGSQVGPSGTRPTSDVSSSSQDKSQPEPQPQVRPRTSARATVARPLTVANYNEDNPEEAVQAQAAAQVIANARSHARQQSLQMRQVRQATGVASSSRQQQWPSAEDEKRRLYDSAVARVERVQGGVARAHSPPHQMYEQTNHVDAGPIIPASPPQASTSAPAASSATSSTSTSRWPTAEEEKLRLFNDAQAAARRAQGLDEQDYSAGGSSSYGTPNRVHAASPQSSVSAGAAIYQQAMSSINRPVAAPQPQSSASRTPSSPVKTQYPTAEEEKAALRRYHEAKAAVERSQSASYYPPPADPEPPQTAPISYDALYPPAPNNAPPLPIANGIMPDDLPPAFDQGSSSQLQPQPRWMTEKEKLRRAYEAQDAAAQADRQPSPPLSAVGGAPAYTKVANSPPPAPTSQTSSMAQYATAAAEKERLKRMYEAQDGTATVPNGPPPTPPPRSRGNTVNGTTGGSPRPALPTPRSPPIPPGDGSASRPLTAAEEKARLRAMYEAEERQNAQPDASPPPIPYSQINSYPASPPNGLQRLPSLGAPPIPTPPPLMPRPPKEYIQETQEEDARIDSKLRAIDQNGALDDHVNRSDPALKLAPFTPFDSGFSALDKSEANLRPPIPAKSIYID